MTIASWLVAMDPAQVDGARARLEACAGVECRAWVRGRLVVVTESRSGCLDEVHGRMRGLAGVRDVALVAAFEDDGLLPPGPKDVR